MQNAIAINNQKISVKEYKGQRVVTFAEVDCVHGRPEGTACRNFKANKAHFHENTDFFLVKPGDSPMDEIRPLKIPPKGLTLLTESGYLMLVKSFTDPLAWTVQRELVNVYFQRGKEKAYTTWRGVPVVGIGALAEKMKMCSTTLRYWMQRPPFRENDDFFLLEGNALREYKLENGLRDYSASALFLVTRPGMEKLLEVSKKAPEQLTLPTPPPAPKKRYIQAPDNREFREAFEKVQRKLTALEEVLNLANRYNVSENSYHQRLWTAYDMSLSISLAIVELKAIEQKPEEYRK